MLLQIQIKFKPQIHAVFILYCKIPLKALGLYNFIRGFGWAYKQGGLYLGGLISGTKKIVLELRDKTYLRNKLN